MTIRCGARPRIHGELLKLGFEVAQSSVAKYMVKRCGPPSQGWRLFRERQVTPKDMSEVDLNKVPIVELDKDGEVITGFMVADNYFELYNQRPAHRR